MTCSELPLEQLLAYLDDEVSAGAAARVRAHLATCEPCRAEAASLGRAGDAVAGLPEVLPAPDFGSRVAALTGSDRRREPAPLFRIGRLAAGVAAAAVLAFAIGRSAVVRDAGEGLGGDSLTTAVLTAAETRAIAEELPLLVQLTASDQDIEPDELIRMIDELDLVESTALRALDVVDAVSDGESGDGGR